MTELVQILVSWPLTLWLVFTVLRRDERRLSLEQLGRAWPPASRLSAGVCFGVVSLPVHFWRTRRTWRGTLQGLAWGAAVTAVDALVEWLIELCSAAWTYRPPS